MPRLRWYTLVNAQTLSDSQTFTQSLIGVGKIYSLRCRYDGTNGATSNTVANIHSMVSKLQVLDGSRVLHSLSMSEEQALNAYMHRRLPRQQLNQAGAGVVSEDAHIDFWLNKSDWEHYIDTANYRSPVISFTHALTISATAGFATGTGKLTVEALLGDSDIPPSRGFLMSKEFESFTAASSGTRTTILPLDLPYAALMVFAAKNAADPTATITNIKVSANSDAFIPFNRATRDLANELQVDFGPFVQTMIQIVGGTAQTDNFDLYDSPSAWSSEAGATAKAIVTVVSFNQVTVAQTTGEAAETKVNLQGYLPLGAFLCRFGRGDLNDFDDPTSYLDPTKFQLLQYILTQGGANSVQVTTHQLAPQ